MSRGVSAGMWFSRFRGVPWHPVRSRCCFVGPECGSELASEFGLEF